MKVTQSLIEDFVISARKNDIHNLSAYLPRNHKLITSNMTKQIRKLKNYYAYGYDTLGNMIALCADGYTRQFTEV